VLSQFDIAYADYIDEYGEFKWSDKLLEEIGVFKITDEIYDDKIYERLDGNKAHWIIVFTKDRFNQRPEQGWLELNQRLYQAMWELKNEMKDSINIGFIDIYEDGEIMKETFDLTVVPSVRYIEYYTAYQMLWTDQRYNFFHTGDFLNFLQEGYNTAPQEVLRSRVLDTRFHLLFEYACAYLA